MDEYAITAKNISKKFTIHHEKTDSIFEAAAGLFQKKKKTEILQALDDVSFNVKHGEIFGIFGIFGILGILLINIGGDNGLFPVPVPVLVVTTSPVSVLVLVVIFVVCRALFNFFKKTV